MATKKFWSSATGDVSVTPEDIDGSTATGQALMQASDAAAAAQVIAPESTVLSPAATTAIAALTGSSTAAQIVAALQAT